MKGLLTAGLLLYFLCNVVAADTLRTRTQTIKDGEKLKIEMQVQDNRNIKLSFYASDGSVIMVKEDQRPSVSPTKNIVAIRSEYPYHFELYTANGELIKDIPVPVKLPNPRIIMADNYNYVIYGRTSLEPHGQIPEYYFGIYNTTNTLIAAIDNIHGSVINAAFIDDDQFILLYEEYETTFRVNPRMYLKCFDVSGKKNWEYYFNDVTSPNSEYGTRFPLFVDENSKNISVCLYDKMGLTENKIWQTYRMNYHPQGAKTWIFNYKGKLIDKKKGW